MLVWYIHLIVHGTTKFIDCKTAYIYLFFINLTQASIRDSIRIRNNSYSFYNVINAEGENHCEKLN